MMYQIEYMGQIVYGPDVDHCILDPKLDEELNAAGTFTFTVPVENTWLWKNIEVFKGEVIIYEDDDIIWFGRPLQIVRNWKNQKVVTCEGALAYFNDSIQATHEYNDIPLYNKGNKTGFFNTVIGLHNDQVRIDNGDHSHEFKIGVIDVDNEEGIYRQVDYQTTAEILQQMCLDTNGGYFILRKAIDPEDGHRKSYIDWYKEAPYGTTQEIQFGLNLLDINQDLNGADICTAVLAFGKDDKTVAGLTKWADKDHPYVMASGSKIYHTGEFIFHEDAYKKYGRVLKIKSWSDISAVGQDNKENLFIKAAQWLEDQNTETTTIECSAADLHYLSEHADKGKLRIGQMVRVTSAVHGIEDKKLPIYKISMSLDSGAKTITMGTPPKRELTDIIKNSGGSTRGSSGATGGGGGSSSGGGSGSGSVSVKDVQVKYPGEDNYRTTVTKKVAKIDLSNISGGVSDVLIDGQTIVTGDIASFNKSDIAEANPAGEAVGNLGSIGIAGVKYNIPSVGNVVEDVTLDGVSIKDPNDNVAKILSRDIIEDGIEGNFEHVVTKDHNFLNGHPSKDFGKKTDILIETDIDDREVVILSNADTPINLQEIGGWEYYEQDFIAQPTGYYDEHGDWRYDPTSPTRWHVKYYANGSGGGSWWFPTVTGVITPFTGHTGPITIYGYKIHNAAYPEITFEFHDPNGLKYKPNRVVGSFNFKVMHAGDANHTPESDDYCNSGDVKIHVSNDGENWITFGPTSAPEDGNGTFIFAVDEYYSYIRMTCQNHLYAGAGYQYFSVYAVPESYIKNLWYKTEDKAWIKQHIPKIEVNPSEQATDSIDKIEIDGTVYDIQTTAPVQDVYLDGSSVLDANGIAQLTSPTIPVTDVEVDGSSVVNNGVAQITMPTIPSVPVQDVYVDGYSVLDAGGIAQIQMPVIPSVPVLDVLVDGYSVVDQFGNAQIQMPTIPSVPVQDVYLDGYSVLDGNGIAQLTSPTIPVTDVTLDGSSVVNNGVAALSSPTIPVQDVQVDGYSVVNQGVAQIQMPVIPSVPVQDVYVDGYSVLDANGIAQIQMPVVPSVPVQDVYLDGYSVLDANGIAQLTSPTIPVTDVEVNGTSVVSQGIASITIPSVVYPVNDVLVDGSSVVDGNGNANITMPAIPVTDVELDGVSVVSQGVASLTSPTIPVTDVTLDGASIVNNGVAALSSPNIPVTDVEVNGQSVVNQGVAEIDASVVEANPSSGTSVGDLTSIKIDGTKYDIPSGGGGTTVVPNPAGQPTEDLDTVQIGNTIFDIPAGTTVIPNPQTQPTERLSTIQIGNSTYRVAEGSGGETVVDFNYTGSIQSFTAPKAGDYILEVWGAQGGRASESVHGGYGGYSVGTVTLAQGDTIYICVGGKGGGNYTQDTSVVGYNGGGEANYGGDRGNGGGATHIATRTGLLYTLSSHQSDILIVAGGGGGSGYYPGDECDGGSGGGYIGGTGETYDGNSHPGTGGTQSAGGETDDYSGQSHGSFGQGASRDDGDLWGGSGGGGGFYGGGASTNNAGAGGGSGYINTTELTDAAMYGYSVSESAATATKTFSVNTHSSDAVPQYAKEGNGHARITYSGGDFDPYVTVGDLYDACVANGVTPASQTLTAIIAAILAN